MSMDILAWALPGSRATRREPAEEIQRLRYPAQSYYALLPGPRERIHALVIQHGIEAWIDGDEIVFHRATYPLSSGGARKAHAHRMAFLLDREGCL